MEFLNKIKWYFRENNKKDQKYYNWVITIEAWKYNEDRIKAKKNIFISSDKSELNFNEVIEKINSRLYIWHWNQERITINITNCSFLGTSKKKYEEIQRGKYGSYLLEKLSDEDKTKELYEKMFK